MGASGTTSNAGVQAVASPLGTTFVALVAAGCILTSVTFPIFEPDFWQHVLIGKVIWTTHAVPTTNLWTWPDYGAPAILGSWGFSAVTWPFWSVGGVTGLFVWRWLSALGVFGLLWATARRLGARGPATLPVLVLCALAYRQRSQVRPETLVAMFLALEIWILETRRQGGPDRTVWLVPVAWAWINSHVSYHLGFLILGAHLLDAHLSPAGAPARRALGRLWWVAAAALAASFLNPFGWRLLWQPFKFFLYLRNDPIMATVGELQPPPLAVNTWNGLPLLMLGWPATLLWRRRKGRFDRVEAMLCLAFSALALSAVRFVGFYALVAAPYLARNLDELLRGRRLPRSLLAPAPRAALVAAACVALCLPEWSISDYKPGFGILWKFYPVRACDYLARADVRGRGYNTFSAGGYLLFRFWPDRGRLPLLDTHPEEADPVRRRLYVLASQERSAWEELQARDRFDWALLSRLTFRGDRLPDFLDADSTWALVFLDDAAALFVRRGGPLRAVAERDGYRLVPAGNRRLAALGEACRRDPALRRRFAAELERQARESPYDATAHGLLANLALLDGDLPRARESLREAVAADPGDAALRARLRALEQRLGP